MASKDRSRNKKLQAGDVVVLREIVEISDYPASLWLLHDYRHAPEIRQNKSQIFDYLWSKTRIRRCQAYNNNSSRVGTGAIGLLVGFENVPFFDDKETKLFLHDEVNSQPIIIDDESQTITVRTDKYVSSQDMNHLRYENIRDKLHPIVLIDGQLVAFRDTTSMVHADVVLSRPSSLRLELKGEFVKDAGFLTQRQMKQRIRAKLNQLKNILPEVELVRLTSISRDGAETPMSLDGHILVRDVDPDQLQFSFMEE